MMELRKLGLADAPEFRAIRLAALRDHPVDFGSEFAIEAALPLAHFVVQLADNHVTGAFLDGQLVGIIALEFRSRAKERHRAFLWGVYVRPQARGRGVAAPLLDAALAAAFGVVEQVELGVRVGNAAAEALYQSRGFMRYGIERNTYRVDGVTYDDALMVVFRGGVVAAKS